MKINSDNKKMIKKLKKEYKNILKNNNNSNVIIYLTHSFMKYILEDIKQIKKMKGTIKNKRYIHSILRLIVEQVIIYKFLMRNNEDNEALCNDFLGENVDLEILVNDNKTELEMLKDLMGNRTNLYKNIFKQMCEKFENINDEASLYGMYSIMADFVHNSYYESIVSEYNNEKFNGDLINTVILYSLASFFNSYNELRKNFTWSS
ncbi:hypothetical protein NE452_01840 [Paeniclostridium sordellii]|uniref:hypothetical protein n=1 Tax=Paraclostridium sordellii TaxID=1505 RepID=UPI00210A4934|nr:hypothetical protein [Paeniclostridium sordellii]MCQ4696251.1 hypothetical protein [Paeniclostridium sordellii]